MATLSRTYGLAAGPALPDTSRLPLHRNLAAERAGVLAVLLDFDLLDLLAERGTVAVHCISQCFLPSSSKLFIFHIAAPTEG